MVKWAEGEGGKIVAKGEREMPEKGRWMGSQRECKKQMERRGKLLKESRPRKEGEGK